MTALRRASLRRIRNVTNIRTSHNIPSGEHKGGAARHIGKLLRLRHVPSGQHKRTAADRLARPTPPPGNRRVRGRRDRYRVGVAMELAGRARRRAAASQPGAMCRDVRPWPVHAPDGWPLARPGKHGNNVRANRSRTNRESDQLPRNNGNMNRWLIWIKDSIGWANTLTPPERMLRITNPT